MSIINELRKWCNAYEEVSQEPINNDDSRLKLGFLFWKFYMISNGLHHEIMETPELAQIRTKFAEIRSYGPDIVCPDVVDWYNSIN